MDALVFYDFCRAVDDIADEPGRSPAEKRELLALWKDALLVGDGLPPELSQVLTRRKIDRKLLVEIVLGVEMDIIPLRYQTHEVRAYCWRVASAVRLVSVEIFGCRNSKVESTQKPWLRLANDQHSPGRPKMLPLDASTFHSKILENSRSASRPIERKSGENFRALIVFKPRACVLCRSRRASLRMTRTP
jgi:hypothetical protein